MKNIYDEIGRASKRNFRELCRLTEPLKKFFGIDRFWRNSHRKDGSYSVIGNYPPTAEVFFGQNLYVGHPYFRNPRFFRSGFALPELEHSSDYEATQGKLREGGDCFHVMIYLHKDEEGVTEYGFASSQFRSGFEATYLNHLQPLAKFISAFEVNGAKTIQMARDCGINIAEVIGAKYHERPILSEAILVPDAELRFLAAIEGDLDKKQGIFSLTPSEKVCLRHYLTGITTKEIAKKLYRSSRTVETHLERAKAKLGVNSRSKLFEILLPYRDFL